MIAVPRFPKWTPARPFAVAVSAGRYQPQRVTYDASGRSTVVPLAGWVGEDEARRILVELP